MKGVIMQFNNNVSIRLTVAKTAGAQVSRILLFAIFLMVIIPAVMADAVEINEYIPGELVIVFRDSSIVDVLEDGLSGSPVLIGDNGLDMISERYEITSIRRVFYPAIHNYQTLPGHVARTYLVRYESSVDIFEVIEAYRSNPLIESVEPNYISRVSYVPNDPRYSSQWSHTKISSEGGWDYSRGNDQTVIAVIDTGVDYTHEDLSDNMLPGYDFVDIDVAFWSTYHTLYPGEEDYTAPDNDPMDVVGHGTHCAGIASAVTDNNTGIAGVGFNCMILPVRAGFKADDSALLDSVAISNALYYAADNGADVISMSFGGGDSSIQRNAIQYAYSMGCVLVAASGNENSNCDNVYPAAYTQVISVGATDSNDQRASFSNYGSTLDVVAPGVNILSTIPGNRYASYNGTSMATPHVAGLAALLHIAQPAYSAEQIRQELRSNADDLGTPGFDNYYGYGRINSEATLQDLSNDQNYLLVTYNDIGIWKLDAEFGFDSQPLMGTFGYHIYHTAAGDLDGDGHDELYANFGSPAGIWVKLLNPEQSFVHCDIPDDLGIHYMFTGDTDGDTKDELYIDCGTAGIYCYKHLTGFLPIPLPQTWGYFSRFGFSADTDGDGKDELYLDYGLEGVWRYEPGKGWASREIIGTAGYMANWGTAGDVDKDLTDELYLDYGTLGIWRFSNNTWFRLPGTAGYQPNWGYIMDGDGDDDLEFYIDYGTEGIWEYTFNHGWAAAAIPKTDEDPADFAVAVHISGY